MARPFSVDWENRINKPRPTSDSAAQKSSYGNRSGPFSDYQNYPYRSTEAQAIDRWFEDLSNYEKTLEQMAEVKLLDSFKEEMRAVDSWFVAQNDCERTTVIYALLRHCTQLQIRFFMTVLQQMAKRDPIATILSPRSSLVSPRVSNHEEDLNIMHVEEKEQREFEASRRLLEKLPPLRNTDDLSSDAEGLSSRRLYDRHSNGLSSASQTIKEPLKPLRPAPPIPYHARHIGNGTAPTSNASLSGVLSLKGTFGPVQTTPVTASTLTIVPSAKSTSPPPHSTFSSTAIPLAPSSAVATAFLSEQSTSLSPFVTSTGTMSTITPPKATSVTSPTSPTSTSTSTSLPSTQFVSISTGTVGPGPIAPPTQSNSTASSLSTSPPSVRRASVVTPATTTSIPSTLSATITQSSPYPVGSVQPIASTISSQHSPLAFANVISTSTAPTTAGATAQTPSYQHSQNAHPSAPLTISTAVQVGNSRYAIPDMDIPAWLKSLRLHKYSSLFENMTWEEMVELEDSQLQQMGMAALGARRKILKAFESIKSGEPMQTSPSTK